MAQGRRGNHRRVGNAYTVMDFVALLQPAQDADRILNRGLPHKDWLEAPLQRGIFLNVLAIFFEGRRANRVQFSPRQQWLEHVARIHRPFRCARADQSVHLIDKEDDLPLAALDLLQHRLEPLFKFTAVLGPGNERAEVERHQLFVAQTGRYITVDNALGQPFGNRGLTHTRLTD